jgi:hypothetical protein
MSASALSVPATPRARLLIATLVVAVVLAVALIAIGAALVTSASSNSSAIHGAIPGLDHSGGLNRYQIPR